MKLTIHEQPKIHETAFVAPNATIIGDVTIGEYSNIWYHATIRSDVTPIKIGSFSNVQDNAVIHLDPWTTVEIGDYVTIGHSAIIHGCKIGNNCIIGMGAIVMNDTVIGNNCIIGAGALITENKTIPDNSLVVGSPAKVIRTLTDEDIEKIKLNALHYVEISKEYKKLS